MAKKQISVSPKHSTTLKAALEHSSVLLLFGKPVSDLPSTGAGHGFAHIFGYQRDGQCQRLPHPVLISVPDPEGPASACGFDPAEYSMWRVPDSFLTSALHIEHSTVSNVLAKHAMAVASCVDGATAIAAVNTCQMEVLGHQVSLDTKLSDVLQGADLSRFCSCVSRESGVANMNCTGSMTFLQVARGITCD